MNGIRSDIDNHHVPLSTLAVPTTAERILETKRLDLIGFKGRVRRCEQNAKEEQQQQQQQLLLQAAALKKKTGSLPTSRHAKLLRRMSLDPRLALPVKPSLIIRDTEEEDAPPLSPPPSSPPPATPQESSSMGRTVTASLAPFPVVHSVSARSQVVFQVPAVPLRARAASVPPPDASDSADVVYLH